MPTASVQRQRTDADERTGRDLPETDPNTSWLPCRADPDLWFAEDPHELERAKALCGDCPIKAQCLAGALERAEPWGVWGGEILNEGVVVQRKRPRGRPRKYPRPDDPGRNPASSTSPTRPRNTSAVYRTDAQSAA